MDMCRFCGCKSGIHDTDCVNSLNRRRNTIMVPGNIYESDDMVLELGDDGTITITNLFSSQGKPVLQKRSTLVIRCDHNGIHCLEAEGKHSSYFPNPEE